MKRRSALKRKVFRKPMRNPEDKVKRGRRRIWMERTEEEQERGTYHEIMEVAQDKFEDVVRDWSPHVHDGIVKGVT